MFSTLRSICKVANHAFGSSPLRVVPFIVGAFTLPAHATNYALIMTIGNYSNPQANLPGIDLDAKNASVIAKSLGVSDTNIQYLSDSKLTAEGFRQAFKELAQRISKGDSVFIYYSGHGTQSDAGGGKCSEGMVSYDMNAYRDSEIQQNLAELSSKANRVIMMNDSCFSGGLAQSKSTRGIGGSVVNPKSYKLTEAATGYTCGDAINMKILRNIVPRAKSAGTNLLYIAASQDNEVANASSEGSFATLGWKQCISSKTDADHSGALSGEEIKVCTQRFIEERRINQHVVLVGNKDLPLVFVGDSTTPEIEPVAVATNASSPELAAPDLTLNPPTASETTSTPPVANTSSFSAANALNDLHNAASPAIIVNLKLASDKLKIHTDPLNFTVSTNKSGYLSILQVGSDGKTFNRIFPNDNDQNNYVQAGLTVLPRATWQIKAGGPVGNSYLLAIISDTQRDFSAGMKSIGPFKTGSGARQAKNLYVVATESQENKQGNYGASEVVTIQEY